MNRFTVNPEILTQHVIPCALHGINPRTSMKPYDWTKLKKKYQQVQNMVCGACGTKVSHTPGDYLELHEEFQYDYENKKAYVETFVGLCKKCHLYIHSGYLTQLKLEGKISKEDFDMIMMRGDKILRDNDLVAQHLSGELLWAKDWELYYQGKKLN